MPPTSAARAEVIRRRYCKSLKFGDFLDARFEYPRANQNDLPPQGRRLHLGVFAGLVDNVLIVWGFWLRMGF